MLFNFYSVCTGCGHGLYYVRKCFFSERVINRWNKLFVSQDDVDETSLNGFKSVLERRQKDEMDFFMD